MSAPRRLGLGLGLGLAPGVDVDVDAHAHAHAHAHAQDTLADADTDADPRLAHAPRDVLVLGAANAGKTTLVKRLRTGATLCFPPTEFTRCETARVPGVGWVRLWELWGYDERFPLRRVPAAAGALFVVDGTDRAALADARDRLARLLACEGQVLRVAVLLNKSDLVRKFLHVAELAEALRVPPDDDRVQAFVASSTDALGATEALAWLLAGDGAGDDAREFADDGEDWANEFKRA